MTDLSLVGTDEMMHELEKRFDSMMFSGQVDKTDVDCEGVFYFKGNQAEIVFMANRVIHNIMTNEVEEDA